VVDDLVVDLLEVGVDLVVDDLVVVEQAASGKT
jgi:hypothetical protein